MNRWDLQLTNGSALLNYGPPIRDTLQVLCLGLRREEMLHNPRGIWGGAMCFIAEVGVPC